jgi:hypothetical protein
VLPTDAVGRFAGLGLVAAEGVTAAARPRTLFSPGARTIEPDAPAGRAWFSSSVAESDQGTSATAIRSTEDGSGIERPVAAKTGTGRQIPTTISARSQRLDRRGRAGAKA